MLSIMIFTLGWMIGLIINYFADTLPIKRVIAYPFCKICGRRQALIDYFIWPRRCDICGYRRLWRSIFVEIIYGSIALWLWLIPQEHLGFVGSLILFAYLGLVMIIDIEHRLIIHQVSLVGIIICGGLGLDLHGLLPTIYGCIVGFVFMLGLYYFGLLFVQLLSKMRKQTLYEKEGLGFGDVILGGLTGLILGFPGIIAGIVITIIFAGIVSLIYYIYKILTHDYSYNLALPFGPFMVMSIFFLLFFYQQLVVFLQH
jgi:prepilin signal peptidase PulO-like enzyme (type II secretory pathway)